MHTDTYSSKIIFMGYWLLKRNIREIGLLYTLRSATGDLVSRKYVLIKFGQSLVGADERVCRCADRNGGGPGC